MKKTIKIVFFGTPDIAVPTLEALKRDKRFEIVGVGTFPDRKVGRKKVLTPTPVKKSALSLKIPVYEIESKEDVTTFIKTTQPEIALVIAFGFLFKKSHLESIPLGMINVHFSLLPLYRGASPVQSALLAGDKTSGISWQKMVRKLDAGPLLDSEEYCIKGSSTTEDIFNDFATKTAAATAEILMTYVLGKAPSPQDETQASFCGKFNKEDGAIDIKKETSQEIFNKWRAFSPWPGIFLNSSKVKLLHLSQTLKPGSLVLDTAENTELFIQKIQIPGKKPMNALDAWRGNSDLLPDFQKKEKTEDQTK